MSGSIWLYGNTIKNWTQGAEHSSAAKTRGRFSLRIPHCSICRSSWRTQNLCLLIGGMQVTIGFELCGSIQILPCQLLKMYRLFMHLDEASSVCLLYYGADLSWYLSDFLPEVYISLSLSDHMEAQLSVRIELAKCISNPACAANVACLQTCNNRPDETECQVIYLFWFIILRQRYSLLMREETIDFVSKFCAYFRLNAGIFLKTV